MNVIGKNGLVENWDNIEDLYDKIFMDLKVNPSDHSIILSESSFNT